MGFARIVALMPRDISFTAESPALLILYAMAISSVFMFYNADYAEESVDYTNVRNVLSLCALCGFIPKFASETNMVFNPLLSK